MAIHPPTPTLSKYPKKSLRVARAIVINCNDYSKHTTEDLVANLYDTVLAKGFGQRSGPFIANFILRQIDFDQRCILGKRGGDFDGVFVGEPFVGGVDTGYLRNRDGRRAKWN
jgi:hypothetical protein